MSETNKNSVKEAIQGWLTSGNNVIIVTRTIDNVIDKYLTSINIEHTMNGFKKGILSVYAPTKDIYNQLLEHEKQTAIEEFARIKTEFVTEFLKKSNTKPENSFFIDDTKDNVDAMKEAFKAAMTCTRLDTPGDYNTTIELINKWITNLKSTHDVA